MKLLKTLIPGRVTAWPRRRVTAFGRSDRDILVLARRPLPGVAEAMRVAVVADFRSDVTAADADRVATAGLSVLRIDCPPLAADITGLTRSYLAQFGRATATLRIEVVQRATCPGFHCDNVHCRLVTTYHGPATEYRIDGDNATHTAPPFGLVFLKGHKHPTHRDTVHHRSPDVPAGMTRLCVVLNET